MPLATDIRAEQKTAEAMTDRNLAGRVVSIDFMRGLVMVIMAIDHTRDYFTNVAFEPENLSQTWMALFLTRWVTHFCAPLFFFLAGTGAFYYGLRRTPSQLSRFLWTRGLWLIVIEFTLVGTAWTFKFPWGFFGVIWALGASMVILAGLARLPVKVLVWLSLAVVLCHDLFDGHRPSSGTWTWLWRLLHVKGGVNIFGIHEFVLFPIVPWFAVMALGFCFGALLQRQDRLQWTLRIGLIASASFIVLRAFNLYGNPPALPGGVTAGDFHLQPAIEKSIILFLDTEKYPPSLQFLLMTLGPSLVLLWALEKHGIPAIANPIVVFGRVPFLFYVLHLYLIHMLAVLTAMAVHQPYTWLLHGAFWFFDLPEGYGHNLPCIYLVWAMVVVLLYWPCKRFATLKTKRKNWWLSYL